MTSKIGLCHFCNAEKKFAKSHIIPEYFYRRIRKGAHHLKLVSSDSNSIQRSFIGDWDKKILCLDCESHFANAWDDYGIRFFQTATSWPKKEIFVDNEIRNYYEILEFDYTKLKLFFLSILWRAHVSKREVWKNVNLGLYEQKALELLKSNSPGSPNDFSVFLSIFKETLGPSESELHKVMANPYSWRSEKNKFYQIQLNEFIVNIKVDSQSLEPDFEKISLKENPPLFVIERDFKSSKEYQVLVKMVNATQ